MSFDYYQKSGSPSVKPTKTTLRPDVSTDTSTTRKEALTKSVKKRKQTIAFEDPELSFSFTTTRPESEKDASSPQRPSKSSAATSSRLNNSTTKKTASSASNTSTTSRPQRSTTDAGSKTQVPSKASAEIAAEEQKSKRLSKATSASGMPPTPSKTSRTPSKAKRKAEKPYLDADSEPEAEESNHSIDSPATPPHPRDIQHPTTEQKEDVSNAAMAVDEGEDPIEGAEATIGEETSEMARPTRASDSRASQSSAAPSKSSKSGNQPQSSSGEALEKSNPKKRNSKQTPEDALSKKPKLAEEPVLAARTSSSAKGSSKSNEKDARDEIKAVELEDNLVSYWDFVTERRGETLLQKMKRDKKRKITAEEEEMVRIVKNRFYVEATAKFRPPEELVPNPINEELEIAITRYQRIIDLLERENAELEIIDHRARLQLEAEEEEVAAGVDSATNTTAVTAKSAPSTPGRSKRGAKSAPNSAKKTTATQRRASMAPIDTMDVSTPTESSVAQIFKSLPSGESLLADEDKAFLTARPALGANVDLRNLSRLQTRFDALELLTRQIGFTNDSFEDKAAATSAAMRAYMAPSGASKINLKAMLANPAE